MFFLKRGAGQLLAARRPDDGHLPRPVRPRAAARSSARRCCSGSTASAGRVVRGDARRAPMPVHDFESLVRLVMSAAGRRRPMTRRAAGWRRRWRRCSRGACRPCRPISSSASQVGNRVVTVRGRSLPIRYFVTNRDVAGVTAPQLQAAIDRAFARWRPCRARLSIEFVGFTSAEPFVDDGTSVIGFRRAPISTARSARRRSPSTRAPANSRVRHLPELESSTGRSPTAETGALRRRVDRRPRDRPPARLGHSALGETELVDAGGGACSASAR